MNKEKLREIIYLVVAIAFAIIAVQFVIWLLPFILIVLVAGFIYGAMKRNKNIKKESKDKKDKNKKIVIIDEHSDNCD